MDKFQLNLTIGMLKDYHTVGPNSSPLYIRPAYNPSSNWGTTEAQNNFWPVNGPSHNWANRGPIYVSAYCRPVNRSTQLRPNNGLSLLKAHYITWPK